MQLRTATFKYRAYITLSMLHSIVSGGFSSPRPRPSTVRCPRACGSMRARSARRRPASNVRARPLHLRKRQTACYAASIVRVWRLRLRASSARSPSPGRPDGPHAKRHLQTTNSRKRVVSCRAREDLRWRRARARTRRGSRYRLWYMQPQRGECSHPTRSPEDCPTLAQKTAEARTRCSCLPESRRCAPWRRPSFVGRAAANPESAAGQAGIA